MKRSGPNDRTACDPDRVFLVFAQAESEEAREDKQRESLSLLLGSGLGKIEVSIQTFGKRKTYWLRLFLFSYQK